MNAPYPILAQRIQDEVVEIERTINAISRHWKQFKHVRVDQDAYLNSVALNLHSFYSGVERILELIAVEIDGGALGGEAWHAELLRQMMLGVPKIRPPVLSEESGAWLDEYRKFRHRVRNIYATNLVPDRMQYLVKDLPAGWRRVRKELLAFADFVEKLGQTDEE